MNIPPQYPLARHSAGVAPRRRPNSVRRTTSIDSTWPDGPAAPWSMDGHARDILTPDAGGSPVVLDEAGYHMRVSPSREILEVRADPPRAWTQQLVGIRAGRDSRLAIASAIGDPGASPLYQILDDFAGASLVARWVWSFWSENWQIATNLADNKASFGRGGNMLDVCTGFAAGSSALAHVGDPDGQSSAEVGPLPNPDDPEGWHDMPEPSGAQMRRARRIDLWRDAGFLKVDAAFQDSGAMPSGGRRAVHEYRVHATIDPRGQTLVSLDVQPLILPFAECPGAAQKAARMVGGRVEAFRESVLETLPGPLGCTHLNDVLRALADVPALASHLR